MSTTTAATLTYAEAQRIVREAIRDKTYQLYPIGMEAAAYMGSVKAGSEAEARAVVEVAS